jgi:hypothetical protein
MTRFRYETSVVQDCALVSPVHTVPNDARSPDVQIAVIVRETPISELNSRVVQQWRGENRWGVSWPIFESYEQKRPSRPVTNYGTTVGLISNSATTVAIHGSLPAGGCPQWQWSYLFEL